MYTLAGKNAYSYIHNYINIYIFEYFVILEITDNEKYIHIYIHTIYVARKIRKTFGQMRKLNYKL